ncbi:unnamed protein product [Protopolystoma xenopodis]|uniref:Uncharacterized protein n=1 Tax=Protopolystoma xenopodis TaxID=117903 RepID=A0A448XQQ2_9PLAT|nr:unnamed protein product [Protopolystoma xenopodis]
MSRLGEKKASQPKDACGYSIVDRLMYAAFPTGIPLTRAHRAVYLTLSTYFLVHILSSGYRLVDARAENAWWASTKIPQNLSLGPDARAPSDPTIPLDRSYRSCHLRSNITFVVLVLFHRAWNLSDPEAAERLQREQSRLTEYTNKFSNLEVNSDKMATALSRTGCHLIPLRFKIWAHQLADNPEAGYLGAGVLTWMQKLEERFGSPGKLRGPVEEYPHFIISERISPQLAWAASQFQVPLLGCIGEEAVPGQPVGYCGLAKDLASSKNMHC